MSSSANGGNTVPMRSVLTVALINATVVRGGRILLVLYALALGAQPLTVGLLAATSSAIPLLLVLPAGKLADRFGVHWLLVVGCVGSGIGLFTAFAFPGLSTIFIATAMIGMSFSIYNVSLQNLVGLLSTPDNRTRDFSNYSLVMSLSNFAGPLVAGFSIDHVGHATACLYLALVSLVPLAMFATWGRKLPGGTHKKARAKGGVRNMLATPGVYRTLTTSSLLHTGQDLFQSYLPVYAHGIGLSASAIGIVLAMNSAAAFVVRIFLPRLVARFKEEHVLAYAFAMGAIALMLIPLFHGAAALAVVAFVFGLGMGCGQPIVTMQMFSNSAEGRSGEALGLRMTVNHFTKIVGPVAFGAVGSAFGLFTVFWLNALMLGTGSVMSRHAQSRLMWPDCRKSKYEPMSSANGQNSVPIRSVLTLALINATVVRGGRVLLVLYALALGAQPLTVGLLAATSSAIPLLLVLPAGKLADRFGARWLLVIGGVGSGIGLLIAFAFPGMSVIFIATAMIGMSFSIYNVSLQNLVGLLSTPDSRTRDFSNYSLMMSLSNFAGPLVAGFSIDHVGHAMACLSLALMSLVPLAMLATWGRRLPAGTHKKARAKGGVRTMLAAPGVYRTLTTSSLLQSGQDLFQSYLPVYAHGIGLSASAIGIVLAMNSAAAFVVRIWLPRLMERFKEDRVLTYAFGVGALALIMIPLFQGATALAVIAFVFGLGMGCGQPIITMQMFSNSTEGRSGEALGLRMMVNHFTKIVGPVAFGSIGSAFGLSAVFWLNALMLGTGSVMSRKSLEDTAVSEEPKNGK